MLLEPLRHVANPGFGAVFFRRNRTQITNEGGLWDESLNLYPAIGAEPLEYKLEWKFKSGASVGFHHLEHEKTVYNWQGSQIPLLCFDELTHFSAKQFWYMLSRNRSMCGVRPYIRAGCNPDADSWVADLIAWWIDQDTGLPIPERAGVIRYFVRVSDTIIWADRPGDLAEHTMLDEIGQRVPIPPKSLTFIPASVTDNKALMAADPGYLANLMALPMVDRERLLGGNWKIRPASGLYFKRSWCEVVDAAPAGLRFCRGWDLAATPKTESNDPDWTAGTKIGTDGKGRFFVCDHQFDQLSPDGVEKLIKNTASADGKAVEISIPQDPGAAGKAQAQRFVKLLAGYRVHTSPETGDKVTRFGGFSAQAEAGNVYIVRGDWNERWCSTLENFPPEKNGVDDDADSTSRAFNRLVAPKGRAAMILKTRHR